MRKLFVNPALFDKRVTVVQSEADTADNSPNPDGLPNEGSFINLRLEPYWLLVEQRPGASSLWFRYVLWG